MLFFFCHNQADIIEAFNSALIYLDDLLNINNPKRTSVKIYNSSSFDIESPLLVPGLEHNKVYSFI